MFLSFLFVIAAGLCFAQKNTQYKQLDSIFSVLHSQNQFNGSVLIADKGKVLLKKGYGIRDEKTKALNNPGTVFELASCTKQFTAMGIVLLKKDGKLNYDDKISKYIPELSCWDKVTIYDLLRHTSGIPEFLVDMEEDKDPTKILNNQDLINFYANRHDTLRFEPKTRHRYSNTNYALLASIIERASGRKYADYLHERIFKPLKMKNTFVYNRRETPRAIKNYATGYVWAKDSFEKVTSENPRYGDRTVYYLDGVVGAAKVNSTVEDLFRWITALKNNTLITRQEFEEMTAVTKTSLNKNISYGFGFDVSKGENKFAFGHTGSWDGYISFISQNMIKDKTIIILENFNLGTYSYDNINQVLDNKPLSLEYKTKLNLPDSEMKTFSGIYKDEKEPEEQHIITCKNGHLFYNTNKVKWDMRFFPVSGNEFQAIRQGGRDGVLRFTTQADGATRLEMIEYGKVIGSGVKLVEVTAASNEISVR
ncbi:beta-lactamase family protein [Chitinophaga sp. Mgbs1]|uniref:Beta-lactamase family protein n=1 Tax=Chitinophaga solisilvae TaxID=1233460 RepID=A0A9Q5D4B7_9BACT|nr:beta-lactamase family protein [Chitinophaga solisilvae]